MLKKSFSYIIGVLILGLVVRCSTLQEKTLTIGCASNLQIAMDSIIEVFEIDYEVNINLVCHSSGTLYSQIELGAPIDIYISANLDYPQSLVKRNKCETPIPFARGHLLLAYQNDIKISKLSQLVKNENIQRIAIANIKSAPYGIAAKKHLEQLNLFDQLQNKIISGESISQVGQYLKTKTVDAGFVSNSFKIQNGKSFNYLTIRLKKPKQLEHYLCEIKKNKSNNAIERSYFIKFLSSQKSKDILTHFGYLPL